MERGNQLTIRHPFFLSRSRTNADRKIVIRKTYKTKQLSPQKRKKRKG